jgi:serine/threonine protein kinase
MNSPAQSMHGMTLPGGWTLVRQASKAITATGGHFSASYIVQHEDGREAFLKAIDFVKAFNAPDITKALEALAREFNFERDLAMRCRDRGMTRVVRAIEHGTVEVPGGHALPRVSYLIFELADGDIRKYVETDGNVDVAWAFRMLHGVALGLRQLHSEGIVHQDLKPSNVMTFGADISKIGDLGRAGVVGGGSPFDSLRIAGDMGYAPPELLYGHMIDDWSRRRAGDLFHLGSLLCFQFTGMNATAAIFSELAPEHYPHSWGGSYEGVLIYLRDALNRCAARLPCFADDKMRSDLVQMFRELCDPDPALRGHPKARAMRYGDRYAVDRYVSRFDALSKRAHYKSIKITSS